MGVTVAIFGSFFVFLGILFWVSYARGRKRQAESQEMLLKQTTQLRADDEERQRQREQEREWLRQGALNMMATYLQRMGASSQMAAWISRSLVEVPASDMAVLRLYFLPLQTVVDTLRRATVGGKELVRERNLPDVRKEYAEKLARGVVRSVNEAFTNLPTLQHMVVIGYVPVLGARAGVICGISVRATRGISEVVRDLGRGSALDLLRQFEWRLDYDPNTWELGEVSPFELPLAPPTSFATEGSPPSKPALTERVEAEQNSPVGATGMPTVPDEATTAAGGGDAAKSSPPAATGPAPRGGDPAQMRFEAAVEAVLQQGGMRVLERSMEDDGSLNIQAASTRTGSQKLLFRCRRTRDPIEAREIGAWADEMADQNPEQLYFVTTSTFVLDAVKIAAERKVELIDGAKLNSLWTRAQASGIRGQAGMNRQDAKDAKI